MVERKYNILQTEDIPDNLRDKILSVRNSVEEDLAGLTYGRHSADISIEYNNVKRGDGDLLIDENGIAPNDIGIKKLDIFDGMDSIAIRTVDMRKIVEDYNRFYDEHSDKVDLGTKKVLDSLKKSFDETTDQNFYDDNKIELAARFLVFEVGFKSKENELFYSILDETSPSRVDKYIKRLKLITTKNFVRPTGEYLESLKEVRRALYDNPDKAKEDRIIKLIDSRIKKKGHNVLISDENWLKVVRNDCVFVTLSIVVVLCIIVCVARPGPM